MVEFLKALSVTCFTTAGVLCWIVVRDWVAANRDLNRNTNHR